MAMAEPAGGAKKVLVVSSSPRRDGNSRLLTDAAFAGTRETGHSAELVHLDETTWAPFSATAGCAAAPQAIAR